MGYFNIVIPAGPVVKPSKKERDFTAALLTTRESCDLMKKQTDDAESKPITRLQRAGGAVIPAANVPVWMDR
ncbi:hypothetical protein [Yanshouia hominis]|uniref:Uncharacterized protein n=1 Tax=Yanshouia hominis TaxID=2763673 RepID=A0ABR7NHL4_9FIRM|nr:hypothetical protein [Yanshouia hominis]MBC8575897.1 hypothetical protein [Yanshouia hominis]